MGYTGIIFDIPKAIFYLLKGDYMHRAHTYDSIASRMSRLETAMQPNRVTSSGSARLGEI